MKELAREILQQSIRRGVDRHIGAGRSIFRLMGFRIAAQEVGAWYALPVLTPPKEDDPPVFPTGEWAFMVGWSAIGEADRIR